MHKHSKTSAGYFPDVISGKWKLPIIISIGVGNKIGLPISRRVFQVLVLKYWQKN